MVSDRHTVGKIAPLQNVTLCASALKHAHGRSGHLPALVVFYGPSGFGKSYAAVSAANKHRAYYVVARSVWTKKAMLLAILREIGVVPARTIYEMLEQVAEQLRLSGRALIIDEFDHLVRRGMVELVRDLYEASGAPILIIGEEQLPARLLKWERFHNRVLEWLPAEPAHLADARALSRLYCAGVAVADDLLEAIVETSKGGARRICVNLDLVLREAARHGWRQADLGSWGKRAFYTGEAPARRL